MSYDKQNWVTGEVITADKLNHIEEGIENAGGGAGALFVTLTEGENNSYTADKTIAEIAEALNNGTMCYAKVPVSGTQRFIIAPIVTTPDTAGVLFASLTGSSEDSSLFTVESTLILGRSMGSVDMWMVVQETVRLQKYN